MKNSVNRIKSALGEAQNVLNWNFRVLKAPSAAGAFDPSLELRIQSSAMPSPQITNTTISLGGHEFGSRGKVTKKGSISIAFVEGVDAKVTSWFLRYLNAYWSADGSDTQGAAAGTTESLKGDYEMTLMDGQNKTTISCKMVGCLLVPDLGSQHAQNAGELIRSASLEYDDFHYNTPDISW